MTTLGAVSSSEGVWVRTYSFGAFLDASIVLLIDLGLIGAPRDIIETDTVKICKGDERIGGRDPFSSLKFGQQCLLDPGRKLKLHLGQAVLFPQKSQIVPYFHNDILSYYALTNYDNLSYNQRV